MRKLDYEFIFTCGIVAFIAALGMVAGIVVLAGAKIYVYNLPLIVGSFLAIGGLLWGLLLVLNNDKVEKRTKHRYCSDSIEHFAVSYIFSNYSAPIRKIALRAIFCSCGYFAKEIQIMPFMQA